MEVSTVDAVGHTIIRMIFQGLKEFVGQQEIWGTQGAISCELSVLLSLPFSQFFSVVIKYGFKPALIPTKKYPLCLQIFSVLILLFSIFAVFSVPSLHVVLGLSKIAPKSFKPTVNLLHSFSVVTQDLQTHVQFADFSQIYIYALGFLLQSLFSLSLSFSFYLSIHL